MRAKRSGRAAVAFDVLGGRVGFWVPGLGRAPHRRLDDRRRPLRRTLPGVRAHRARRIDRGDRLGADGQVSWAPPRSTAFVLAFVGSAALWWVYFDQVAERQRRGDRAVGRSRPAGRHGLSPGPPGDHRRHHPGGRQPIISCWPTRRDAVRAARAGCCSAAPRCSWPATRCSRRWCCARRAGELGSCAAAVVLALFARRPARVGAGAGAAACWWCWSCWPSPTGCSSYPSPSRVDVRCCRSGRPRSACSTSTALGGPSAAASCPATPCTYAADRRGQRRGQPGGQQRAEQPAQHVAAAGRAQPGRAGRVDVGRAVRGGDHRGVALEQHGGAQVAARPAAPRRAGRRRARRRSGRTRGRAG